MVPELKSCEKTEVVQDSVWYQESSELSAVEQDGVETAQMPMFEGNRHKRQQNPSHFYSYWVLNVKAGQSQRMDHGYQEKYMMSSKGRMFKAV